MIKTPRPYQVDTINAFVDWWPTPELESLINLTVGMGKTFTATKCVEWVLSVCPSAKILWMAPTEEIIKQTADTLRAELGVPVGVEKAEKAARAGDQVVVASVMTLHEKRLEALASWFVPDLVVNDEAHYSFAPTWLSIKRCFAGKKVLNLTATPYRSDFEDQLELGRVLASLSISDGIKLGVLVPPVPVGTVRVKLPKPPQDGSDYETGSLAKVLMQEKVLSACVSELVPFLKKGRRGLVFAVNVPHAKELARRLRVDGVRVAEIYAETTSAEREDAYKALREKTVDVLVNNLVLRAGFDEPCIDLVAMYRPTPDLSLAIQMLGRGLRVCPETGKIDCYVLDAVDSPKQAGGNKTVVLPTATNQKNLSGKLSRRVPEALVFLSWFFRAKDVYSTRGNLSRGNFPRLASPAKFVVALSGKPSERWGRNEKELRNAVEPLFRSWTSTPEDPEGYQLLFRSTGLSSHEAILLGLLSNGWRYCPNCESPFSGGDAGEKEKKPASITVQGIIQSDPTLKNFVVDLFQSSKNFELQALNCYDMIELDGIKTYWCHAPSSGFKFHFITNGAGIFVRTYDGRFLYYHKADDSLGYVAVPEVLRFLPPYAKNIDWGTSPCTQGQASLIKHQYSIARMGTIKKKLSRVAASAMISIKKENKSLTQIASLIERLDE